MPVQEQLDQDQLDQEQSAQHQQHSVEALEIAIGKQVRSSRKRLNLTVAALAKQAKLSTGMLSKIENGQTSPSLATLTSLANALQVPVTSFFRGYEEQRDVTYIRKGEGLPIERRGSWLPDQLLLRVSRHRSGFDWTRLSQAPERDLLWLPHRWHDLW